MAPTRNARVSFQATPHPSPNVPPLVCFIDHPLSVPFDDGQLEDAARELSQDESVRAVVFSSAVPRVFCAGADLKERATMSDADAELFVARLRTLMSKIASIPAPTIAAMEGR